MSAAAAPAVAPAPTGEVTGADRDPASTGRAEVLAPAWPGSSARTASATYLRLRRRGSNGAYGKRGGRRQAERPSRGRPAARPVKAVDDGRRVPSAAPP